MATIVVLGVVLVVSGLGFGWYALRPLAVLPRLLRSEVVAPAEVSADSGFVVCRGRAESVGESLDGPFTGEPCLGVEYEIAERALTPSEVPFTWRDLDDGVATVPFELRGDSDRVRVEPESRRFALDTEPETVVVPAGERPPERIESFLAVREGVGPASAGPLSVLGIGTRRYVERRIDLDEPHVIAGRPERTDGRTVLTGALVITDRSPRAVVGRRLRAAALPLAVALVFCVLGVALIAIS
ncbi:hypothetical protein NGM10_10420 [Halorussus salilacus]|uniref:hypothetical protein n=1 Tax=Halorussus salilacus TaxID=2953750 RepID=UPI00209D88CC|nr:hypothetical protein [Halorussus salilacus]USZ67144.1 hypothetical protein NGM10_10420 [Halorussus salilacus]